MGEVRRCDDKCHNATGTRCQCWCGGFYHGTNDGTANRETLHQAAQFLEEHGGKSGEVYLEHGRLDL